MPPQNNNTDQNLNPLTSTSSTTPTTGPVVPPTPKNKFLNFIKKKSKILTIAGIIILVALLSLVIFSVFNKTKTGGGEITWWGLWEESSIIQPLITENETENPNVKITYVKQSPQDYRERLTNALAKGTGPDIFTFHNTWAPMFRNDLDTIPVSVINPADFAKTFYPIASSDLTSGTGLIGIPLEYDALTLYINEEIFNKAGKTPPTTWDELRATARALTVKDDQGVITQSGVALGRTENVDHWPEIIALLMLQNGVDLTNPVGKPAEDALSFFTIISTVDGVWDATLPSSTQAFAAGKVAMFIGPSWRAFEINQQNKSLKFKTVPIPQLPKDNPKQADITYATYWAQGVWSKSGDKSESWNFLKFLSSQSSEQKLFANAAKLRNFGEPYSRIDMANILVPHPIVGSIITQATGAKSWYLASRTFDGPTGINSQVANYFGDAINAVVAGTQTPTQALATVALGVTQVLTQYRLVK